MDLEGRLDNVDWALLIELQQNARLSYSELGRRVGLTPPAVIERIRRMEDARVITGYRVVLNLGMVGRPFSAILRVATYDTRSCNLMSEKIRQMPEVVECHRVTGDDCYILKVALPSAQQLEAVIDRLAVFGKTTTCVVLSSLVTHRAVEPVEPTAENGAEKATA